MELSKLQEEFLADHRVLTRGLNRILVALGEERIDEAVAVASDLDREAGAHMAFEEEVLYPRLGEERGQEFVDRLLSEHEAGQRAIKALVDLPAGATPSESERRRIIEDLETALDHVLACGTMVSELKSGSVKLDDQALERLHELQGSSEHWTDRSYPSD